jgi:sterol 3beta-glucosyltransferase
VPIERGRVIPASVHVALSRGRRGDPIARIVILTVGSRGDFQPYLALGVGLRDAGHRVSLATHAPFEDEIREAGLEFRPIEGNPREILESEEGLAWLEAGSRACTTSHVIENSGDCDL